MLLLQEVELPAAEFPGLPTSSPTPSGDAAAPKWPLQKVRDKNKQGVSNGWEPTPNTPHIPAVHSSYPGASSQGAQGDGWEDYGASNGWGGSDSQAQKWGHSAEPEEEELNGYDAWGGVQTRGDDRAGDKQAAGAKRPPLACCA